MSSLIFVAVAVAWAVYLVPKALEHHDESLRSRTVATFSHTMRVLARREAVSSRTTRLVPGTAAVAPAPAAAPAAEPIAGPIAARPVKQKRARSAASRRRIVLITLVVANAGVAGVAAYGAIGWSWQAAPVVLLLAWLVACRLMVRRERSVPRVVSLRPAAGDFAPAVEVETYETYDASAEIVVGDVLAEGFNEAGTQSIPAITAEVAGSWDPVNVPLPTYVSKPPAARRSVRTIDLDSTGVWSAGRSESDSALVAEADAAAREARAIEVEKRRATGS